MTSLNRQERLILIVPQGEANTAVFGDAVRAGLTAPSKQLPCRYFYDQQGSFWFEEICKLPEYYLPRAEREILERRRAEIISLFPDPMIIGELGCGNAAKTRLLIAQAVDRHGTLRYVPVDVSRAMLEETCLTLLQDFPTLEIFAVAGDYTVGLAQLKTQTDRRKLILWLGSNIGNLDRDQAEDFLREVKATMTPVDRFLVGIDLRKDRVVLEKAYDDAAGVTAQFNLNILARINRELGGHFDLTAFQHRAIYNEELGRIEMYLVSRRRQRVAIDGLSQEINFERGEAIHTENSYKYSPAEIGALARASGFSIERQWFDAGHLFSSTLFAAI